MHSCNENFQSTFLKMLKWIAVSRAGGGGKKILKNRFSIWQASTWQTGVDYACIKQVKPKEVSLSCSDDS